MNRTNFKVGDRVRIVSSKSTFFGHTGVITSIDGYATRLVFQVRIDYYPGDGNATFYEESLIQVGAIDEQDKLIEKYASHDAKVLAEAYTKYYKHKQIEAQTFDNPSDFIVNVIFNDPATIIQWKDGTKTVVKCNKGENFDPEKGLVMAITKKALGNKGNYYETIRKWMHPGITVLKTITVKSNGVETEINKVSSSDIEKIIDTMKPDGNFYCYDKKNKEYIAVDNTTGEAFTESFKDKKSCLDWLQNKEKTV